MYARSISIVKPDKIDKGRVVKFTLATTSSPQELAAALHRTV